MTKKSEMAAAKEILILAGLERFPAKERQAKLHRSRVVLGERGPTIARRICKVLSNSGFPSGISPSRRITPSGPIPISNRGENFRSLARPLPPVLRIETRYPDPDLWDLAVALNVIPVKLFLGTLQK